LVRTRSKLSISTENYTQKEKLLDSNEEIGDQDMERKVSLEKAHLRCLQRRTSGRRSIGNTTMRMIRRKKDLSLLKNMGDTRSITRIGRERKLRVPSMKKEKNTKSTESITNRKNSQRNSSIPQ